LEDSLWRSPRLAKLYPGLAANSSFKPTGRFGIGFYSYFLLGSDIKVMSKRYTDGIESRLVLHFQRGLNERAELRPYNTQVDGEWPHGKMTVVRVILTDMRRLQQFVAQCVNMSGKNVMIPPISDEQFWHLLSNALSRLAFCLDVAVVLQHPYVDARPVNDLSIFKIGRVEFCRKFNNVFGDDIPGVRGLRGMLIDEDLHDLIEIIGPAETSLSRGSASNDRHQFHGIAHIGGLTVLGLFVAGIAGVVEAVPISASRLQIEYKPLPSEFKNWGMRQLEKLSKERIKSNVLGDMLVWLCERRVPLSDYYLLNNYDAAIVFIDQLDLESGGEIFVAINKSNLGMTINSLRNNLSMQIMGKFRKNDRLMYILGSEYGDHSVLYNRVWFTETEENVGLIRFTAYWQLRNTIEKRGFSIVDDGFGKYVIGTYTGPDGGVGRFQDLELKSGAEIEQLGVLIKFSPSEH
jgi:hypothetical protein